jgi:hypothetical protein
MPVRSNGGGAQSTEHGSNVKNTEPSVETLEWDALVEEVDIEIERGARSADRGSKRSDGEYFPAFQIGPEVQPDPRLGGPDWREFAPPGSDARNAAEAAPITPLDDGYQKVLEIVSDLDPEAGKS